MGKKIAVEDKTDIPELAPCFNCGVEQGFVYDPEKDRVMPKGQRVGIKCCTCWACSPGAASVKEAIVLWNNLYLMSQTAKVYNTLAKVSSPAEFAVWMQNLLEQAKGINQAKITEAQATNLESLKAALENFAEQYKNTADDISKYARVVDASSNLGWEVKYYGTVSSSDGGLYVPGELTKNIIKNLKP